MNQNALSRKAFVLGIEFLTAYYTNIKTEFERQTVQTVWYEALNHIGDESFLHLIKEYSRDNIFPPQSPTHLLKFYEELIGERVQSIAFEIRELEMLNRVERSNVVTGEIAVYVDYEKASNHTVDPLIKKILLDYSQKKINDFSDETITSYITREREPLSIE